jgi:hypothetical protein
VGTVTDAGGVNVLYGTVERLTAIGNQFWTQDSPGVADQAEEQELLGFSLAVGDFNADEKSDLALGVPREDVEGIEHAGAVNVLYGTTGGLMASGSQFWHQARGGIPDEPEEGDAFGVM